jgi:transcriptional regulator with XRE-family HTH domain
MDRISALRRVLADNVQREMKRLGYTQPALAKKAGMAQSHVSRIINCHSGATIDRLVQLGQTLGVEPWKLLIKGGGEASRE